MIEFCYIVTDIVNKSKMLWDPYSSTCGVFMIYLGSKLS